MTHPTNPEARMAKREGGKGWHWVFPFDPDIHELADTPARDPLDHDGDGKRGGSRPRKAKGAD